MSDYTSGHTALNDDLERNVSVLESTVERRVRASDGPVGAPGRRTLALQESSHDGAATASRRNAFHFGAATLVAICAVFSAHAGARAQSPAQPPASERPVSPAVRDALQHYAAALESLDAAAVKKSQPSIDLEGLKRAFAEMRSLDVDIDNVRVLSGDDASARVSCRVTQTLTPKAGSRKTTTLTRVLRLVRQDSVWVIQSFER